MMLFQWRGNGFSVCLPLSSCISGMTAEVHNCGVASHSVAPPVDSEGKTGGGKAKRPTFKIIVIGDPAVGKTCLTYRFCNGKFPDNTEATIGVDFREKLVEVNGQWLRIQLWDTAGQERFRQSMTAHYYRNVNAVVLVYDVTKVKSFQDLSHWVEECRRHQVNFSTIPAILVGNKCDCESSQILVKTSDAQKYADSLGLPLFETSAKSDSEADHVEAIFTTLIHKLKDSKVMNVLTTEERHDAVIQNLSDCAAVNSEGFCSC